MLQESWLPRWTFYKYSRSISQRSRLSRITTRSRMDRSKVQRVGMNFAQEDHTYRLTPEAKKRYQGQWYLILNKAGKNGPMKLRSDFRAAVSMKNRPHHEGGEQVEEIIYPDQYSRWHHTSWWDKSEWKWKWAHKIFLKLIILLLQLDSFTVDSWSIVTDGGVDRYISHVFFLMHFAHVITLTSCWFKVSQCALHSIHDVIPWCHLLSLRVCLSLLFLSHFYFVSFIVSVFSVRHTIFNVVTAEGTIAFTRNEEYCPWRYTILSNVMSPKLLDIFDYSEISAVIFQNESVDVDTEPSYSCDAELDDEFIGKALSSPLFIQEREEPANLGQVYHSHEESLFYIWQRRCLPTASANVIGWGISSINQTCSWTAARFRKSILWWCDYEWRYYAILMSLTRNNILSSMLRCWYCFWQCSSESVHESWVLRWFLWILALWCPSLIAATANANNNEIRPQIHFW